MSVVLFVPISIVEIEYLFWHVHVVPEFSKLENRKIAIASMCETFLHRFIAQDQLDHIPWAVQKSYGDRESLKKVIAILAL